MRWGKRDKAPAELMCVRCRDLLEFDLTFFREPGRTFEERTEGMHRRCLRRSGSVLRERFETVDGLFRDLEQLRKAAS